MQNIVYRDTRGHLHELWRDAIGQIGTTDLTTKAGAPTAAGDPFAYLETTTGLELVVYRDSGPGGVHSLYWSTGDVGLDNLSLVAGSPAAAGTPVGHFNPRRPAPTPSSTAARTGTSTSCTGPAPTTRPTTKAR